MAPVLTALVVGVVGLIVVTGVPAVIKYRASRSEAITQAADDFHRNGRTCWPSNRATQRRYDAAMWRLEHQHMQELSKRVAR